MKTTATERSWVLQHLAEICAIIGVLVAAVAAYYQFFHLHTELVVSLLETTLSRTTPTDYSLDTKLVFSNNGTTDILVTDLVVAIVENEGKDNEPILQGWKLDGSPLELPAVISPAKSAVLDVRFKQPYWFRIAGADLLAGKTYRFSVRPVLLLPSGKIFTCAANRVIATIGEPVPPDRRPGQAIDARVRLAMQSTSRCSPN